jgi:tRNA(His) 5'-end guanylyltransferase
MTKDSLGDRIKGYEIAARTVLPRRLPVILRVDGKAFHTYTRGLERPFCAALCLAMDRVAIDLCEEIQGAQFAYVQSDEISVLIHGYKRFSSEPWFANEVQKMASVAASVAAARMTDESRGVFDQSRLAHFDARVFVLPEADVCNYFIWRQQDAIRNSIQMLARSLYSHKECDLKNTVELQAMCRAKGSEWTALPADKRQGRCVVREFYEAPIAGWAPGDPEPALRSRWAVDNDVPVFTEDRAYVEKYLATVDETKEAEAAQ